MTGHTPQPLQELPLDEPGWRVEWRTVLNLFVPGNPAPQGSKNAGLNKRTGRATLYESSKRVKPWRASVAAAAREVWPADLLDGPLAVPIMFVMHRPKTLPAHRPTPPAVKRIGDVDKLARCVNDALTGVVFADDCTIIDQHARKRTAHPGEPSGAHIRVRVPARVVRVDDWQTDEWWNE